MGYYTYYDLSVRNDNEISLDKQREASLHLLKAFNWENDNYYINRITTTFFPFDWVSDDSMKWYDWERDMIELSKEFPEIEFVLYGEGEERKDIWRAFIKNGDCIYQAAHIYYDPEPTF